MFPWQHSFVEHFFRDKASFNILKISKSLADSMRSTSLDCSRYLWAIVNHCRTFSVCLFDIMTAWSGNSRAWALTSSFGFVVDSLVLGNFSQAFTFPGSLGFQGFVFACSSSPSFSIHFLSLFFQGRSGSGMSSIYSVRSCRTSTFRSFLRGS